MSRFYFDSEKAVEVVLYVVQYITSIQSVLQILYLADKEHLSRYGRLITGDSYVAHVSGPIGYNIYSNIDSVELSHKPDMDFLSESDIECLDNAIQQYKDLSFAEFRDLTHDDAYKATPLNGAISLDAIVKTLPDSELLLEHLAG